MFLVYIDAKEMLETEFQKWHNKQIEREEALKQVEDKVNYYDCNAFYDSDIIGL